MRTDNDSKLLNIYIPALLFIIGFFWKLYFINHRDICIDEPFTIFNAQKSIGGILKLPAEGEPNPPLFMIFVHLWIRLFGVESSLVRIVPLLFNAITVIFIYFTGKRFFSFWTGLVASALFLFSSYHFFHGLQVRTYSLLSMSTASALYFYMNYLQNVKNHKALAGLILSNLFLVYSHYFGWFVIFAQFITSLIYVRNFRMFLRFQIPSVATVIGFLPMVPIVLKQFQKSSKGTWLRPPNPEDFHLQIYYLLNNKEVFKVAMYIVIAGVLFTAFLLYRKKWKQFNPGVPALFIWWFAPYTFMFLISSKIPVFCDTYILYNSVGLFLFIPALSGMLFQRHKYLEPLAGAVLLVFMFINLRILPDDFSYREVKKAVEFVKKYDTDRNKRIIIIYPVWADLPFAYHYDKAIFGDSDNFYNTCPKNDIYRVWGLSHTKNILNAIPGQRVILFMEGNATNPEERLFEYLDSAYVRIDKAFFPQTFNVGIYDPKPVEPVK
ncbi:MAG: glycosyltransferase family 39 protein [Bacteroidales bacterium]|nr:glycosyltransferase family 39 protein [Bacteroidales bacterium]